MGAGASADQQRKSLVRDHLEKKKRSRSSSGDGSHSPVSQSTSPSNHMRMSASSPSMRSSPTSVPPTTASGRKKRVGRQAELEDLILTEATAVVRERGVIGTTSSPHASPATRDAEADLTAQASAHWHRLLLHAREQRQLEQELTAF